MIFFCMAFSALFSAACDLFFGKINSSCCVLITIVSILRGSLLSSYSIVTYDFESGRRRVEQWISDNRRQIEDDRRYALDQLTHGGYDSLLANSDAIRLFPVSDSANSDTCLMLPDEAYLVFSVRYAERVLPSGPEPRASAQKTEQMMEALSDPKRIALLRLLRQRPHFGREVADELGVSASTASYHIEKLVAAHLVRLELSSGRRFFYDRR